MKMSVPFVTFYDGSKMPMVGLGTHKSHSNEVLEAVKYAIEIGYRHIDTAAVYGNEAEIGIAIREKIEDGAVKREDLFITTKLSSEDHKEEMVVPACRKSLQKLGLDYIDLYLIHSPCAFQVNSSGEEEPSDVDYLETWRGMEECQKQGLAHNIGVSNFSSQQLLRLLSAAKIKPVNNQVEVTMNFNQKPLISFCKENGITVTGYSPLGKPGNSAGISNSWDSPLIRNICQKYGKTPAQVACRYVVQSGATPIPKSVTKSRIKENLDIFDFNLSQEDMDAIDNAGSGVRVVPLEFAKGHKYYPF